MKQGVLLFAHGARDPAWARPFEAVAQRVRECKPDAEVVLAYLEFMSPTLAEAGQRLAARGCTQVFVEPLFLGAGGHVRKDVPVLLAQLSAALPGVSWELQTPIGEADSVIGAMAETVTKRLS